ncbi:hypothetical protein ASPZODRAFT_897576 [Penicilliopsis zonata CBS 506.65]|uniref:Uncharacterized protein n=1 Tax=Penicilliopsis zonata CBS 506.65 TaxID=1073090 RepID=A0A1L9S8W4_9EURO|nr:hypothetical protein ASPZODRAFT_897576 [Penicilliopsis zonata CBS 506.65]OJJ43600.1 hypothetical protein ASPZODRAFT_897576 [Penicilliopsis zonata CBS 506.65]
MVEPANCRTFPEGTVFKNREGRVVSINEDNFRLKRIIGEGSGEMQNVRAAVFEAEHVNAGNKLVVLKMHYDLYPFHAHLSRERYQEAFEDEAEVIQAISGSGHSPQYITHGHIMQTADDPYPDDGEIRILAMSRMEGVRYPLMREAGLVLLPADLKIIMQQTVETLEYMRQQGWQKDIEPDDVFYNPDTKHMYLSHVSPISL